MKYVGKNSVYVGVLNKRANTSQVLEELLGTLSKKPISPKNKVTWNPYPEDHPPWLPRLYQDYLWPVGLAHFPSSGACMLTETSYPGPRPLVPRRRPCRRRDWHILLWYSRLQLDPRQECPYVQPDSIRQHRFRGRLRGWGIRCWQ